jgi:hypothetical protein
MIRIVQAFAVVANDTKKHREINRAVLAVNVDDKDGKIAGVIVADDAGQLIELAPGKYTVKG